MTTKRRNTVIKYGELREVAEMTGFSYDYVRRVIVYKSRNNKVITDTHESLKNAKDKVAKKVAKPI